MGGMRGLVLGAPGRRSEKQARGQGESGTEGGLHHRNSPGGTKKGGDLRRRPVRLGWLPGEPGRGEAGSPIPVRLETTLYLVAPNAPTTLPLPKVPMNSPATPVGLLVLASSAPP